MIKSRKEICPWGILTSEIDEEVKTIAVIHVNKNNFEQEVLRSDKPVLLDFWASWCGPCRMVAPILDAIAADRNDVTIAKINVDEESELAAQFGIMSIPTLMVVKNGAVVRQAVGAQPRERIEALLK